MKRTIAETETVVRIRAAYQFLERRNGEKLGAVWGSPGLGKTTAAKLVARENGGIYLSALPRCTPYQLLSLILLEANQSYPPSLVGAMQVAIEVCKKNKLGIFIDEAERLVCYTDLLETVRTLHDHAEIPIILVGMQGLYESIKSRPVFFDRVLFFFEATQCSIEDARKLADACCDIAIAEDLLQRMVAHSDVGYNLRRLKRIFSYIEETAVLSGWAEVDVATWGDRSFFPEFTLPPASSSRVVNMRGGR